MNFVYTTNMAREELGDLKAMHSLLLDASEEIHKLTGLRHLREWIVRAAYPTGFWRADGSGICVARKLDLVAARNDSSRGSISTWRTFRNSSKEEAAEWGRHRPAYPVRGMALFVGSGISSVGQTETDVGTAV